MRKLISILCILFCSILLMFVACKKSVTSPAEFQSVLTTFKSDVERDRNSIAFSNIVTHDQDWKELVRLNYEFLDILVKSNSSLDSYESLVRNEGVEIFNSEEYLSKLKRAKELASNLKGKYFVNSSECVSCEEFTDSKVKQFNARITSFRKDKAAYTEFLMKMGVRQSTLIEASRGTNGGINGHAAAEAVEVELPDCNNWRFSLCAAACVLTAPTGILFAACMALCIAEFC